MSEPGRTMPGPVRADGRVAHDVSGLAFDLDGTIYLSSVLLPGAVRVLDALAAAGVPYLFATNNSSKSAEQYVRHLHGFGIEAPRAAILTSNDVARGHLDAEGWRRPYVIATPEVEAEYRAEGFEPTAVSPDCVVLTFDTTLTYAKLRTASDLIMRGVPYVATHPDRVCPTPTGPIPDCGSFIALLAEATGAQPVVLGKPYRPMATAIRDRLRLPRERIAFVGDRLYTDIRMANDHGFLAVLTLTGETVRDDLASSPYAPDLVVETLDDLYAYLVSMDILPGAPPDVAPHPRGPEGPG